MCSPWAFVVGCPRSGTTLLQRMLDAHPLMTVANDTHFITRAPQPPLASGDPPLTPELVEQVRTYRRFHRLGLSETYVDAAAASAHTYSEFVSHLYGGLAELKGKPLAGEKSPGYVRHIPWLHELFPWARTVHLVRDGRDVALSALEWASGRERGARGPARRSLWRTEPVATCALWWRWQVASGREGGAASPGRYLEVRYERLVDDSSATMRPVVAFLDLPWAPEVVAFPAGPPGAGPSHAGPPGAGPSHAGPPGAGPSHAGPPGAGPSHAGPPGASPSHAGPPGAGPSHEGRARPVSGLSAKKAWLPPTTGLRDWRSAMAARDLELFEALAGDMLGELGYERAHRSVSPATAHLADQCRLRWEDDQARWRSSNG